MESGQYSGRGDIPASPRRRVTASFLALAAVLLAVAAVHVLALRDGHAWGDDFALYLMHARNLAEGRPYAATGYVYNPQEPVVGPPTYPPGTAVILAPVYRLFGLNFTAMKGAMIACLLAFLAMVFLAFRDDLSLAERLILVLLLGLNPFVLEQTNQIGSHLPFLALLYLAIFLLGRAEKVVGPRRVPSADDGGHSGRHTACACYFTDSGRHTPCACYFTYLWFLAAGVVCYLAFATRTLGALLILALWAAWAAELIRKRRANWPVLAATATAAFAVLAACQAVWLHSDVHYLDQFHSGLRLAGNAHDYANRLAAFWHNGHWRLPSILLCLAVSGLALLGYVEQLWRRITFRELFAAGYAAVILLWPSYQGEHYLLPVYPLYLLYAFLGLRLLPRLLLLLLRLFYALLALRRPWLPRRVRLYQAIAGVLALAIAVTYGIRLSGLERSPLAQGIAKRESQELFEAVRKETRPGDLVVFVKPRAMALFTGRKAMSYHTYTQGEDEKLWASLAQHEAGWLVVVENDRALLPDQDRAKMQYLREFVQRNHPRLESVFRNPDFSLYAIRR
jgi:4-amino-4-deoxy-L-arabinose transferase-like glycosyltransferase